MKEGKVNFNEALMQLEKISKQLEDINTPLEEIVELYKQGVKLKLLCEQKLNQAKMEIVKVENELKANNMEEN